MFPHLRSLEDGRHIAISITELSICSVMCIVRSAFSAGMLCFAETHTRTASLG